MSKVLIVGIGYVGLAQALLFREKADVYCVDASKERADSLSNGNYRLNDSLFLSRFGTIPKIETLTSLPKINPDFVLLCLPTDYDEQTRSFDTKALDEEIKKCSKMYPNSSIVIKSTVPIGYTLSKKKEGMSPLFSPEFLRENTLYEDVMKPSRLIVGYDDEKDKEKAKAYMDLILNCVEDKNVRTILSSSMEAEAIKLFSNEYLAMRVAYFNELDNFALKKGLNSKTLIEGVSLDPRIGDFYNNPSFGYGGYCLPKDTKALLSCYGDIPEDLISATILANEHRKQTIAEDIAKRYKGKTVGFYRLSGKKDSPNFRSSPMVDLLFLLKEKNVDVIIYEPIAREDSFKGYPLVDDFQRFVDSVDVIVASRIDERLNPYLNKVYTRDVSHRD